MNIDDLRKIAEELEGTCDIIPSVLEKLDIEADTSDVESDLLDFNLERCPCCGWWMESWELIDEDGNEVGCEQCRQETG